MLARSAVMRLWVEPSVIDEIAALPGNMRQRVRRAVRDLPQDPRPAQSRALDIPEDVALEGIEARRLRMEYWRVIYVIDRDLDLISVLAVRRRPPYNYDNLRELLNAL
jgi:mRNA-degrading endonuclease RelE of RelBE toxin-antitoxin system